MAPQPHVKDQPWTVLAGVGATPEVFHFFAVSQVEEIDLPVKRNQAFIIKFFSKTRERFCDHLLGEGKEKERWKLLTQVGWGVKLGGMPKRCSA